MELKTTAADILRALYEQGTLSPTEIAHAIGLRGCSNVALYRKSLVKMKLIAEKRYNRNNIEISLTAAGEKIAKKLGKLVPLVLPEIGHLDKDEPGLGHGKQYGQLVTNDTMKKLYNSRTYGTPKTA